MEFLSEHFGVESNKFSTLVNGTCLVLKFGQITYNFYTKAKTLQVQGKDSDDLKNNLISLSNENGARTGSDFCSSSTTAEVPNQDGVVGHESDETNLDDGVDFPIESQAIDESDQPFSPQGDHVSHFNTEIENLKKELLELRFLVSRIMDKSLGTLLRFWAVFQFTPQTMLDACIQKFFRVSTLYRVEGERTARKFRK